MFETVIVFPQRSFDLIMFMNLRMFNIHPTPSNWLQTAVKKRSPAGSVFINFLVMDENLYHKKSF